MARVLLALGKIALVFAIGFPLLMYLAQDSLIFHPQRLAEPARRARAGSGGLRACSSTAPTARACTRGM